MVALRIGLLISICWWTGCVTHDSTSFTPKPGTSTETPSHSPSMAAADSLRIHFVNVGQGDCTLIQCPDGRDVLIDCGSLVERDKEATEAYLLNALADDKLEVLVITHPDADHYNMIPFVLRNIAVDRLLFIGTPSEYSKRTHNVTGSFVANAMRNWIEGMAPADRRALTLADVSAEGQPSTHFGSGNTHFYILAAEAPQTRAAWAANTRSIVLRVSHDEFDTMLTGDATTETESFVLGRFTPTWLDCELLKIGHHGSGVTSTSPAWAATVRPELSIASATIKREHGHPNRNVVLRLAALADLAPPHALQVWQNSTTSEVWQNYDRAVYCTANSGHIVVESDGDAYSVACSD